MRIAHLLSQTSFFLSLLLVCFPLSCFVVPFLVLFLCFSCWVFFSWILVRGNANANANAHSIITCKIKTRRSHSKIKRTSFRSDERSQPAILGPNAVLVQNNHLLWPNAPVYSYFQFEIDNLKKGKDGGSAGKKKSFILIFGFSNPEALETPPPPERSHTQPGDNTHTLTPSSDHSPRHLPTSSKLKTR